MTDSQPVVFPCPRRPDKVAHTEERARHVLSLQPKAIRRMLTVYECEGCHAWHLGRKTAADRLYR